MINWSTSTVDLPRNTWHNRHDFKVLVFKQEKSDFTGTDFFFQRSSLSSEYDMNKCHNPNIFTSFSRFKNTSFQLWDLALALASIGNWSLTIVLLTFYSKNSWDFKNCTSSQQNCSETFIEMKRFDLGTTFDTPSLDPGGVWTSWRLKFDLSLLRRLLDEDHSCTLMTKMRTNPT